MPPYRILSDGSSPVWWANVSCTANFSVRRVNIARRSTQPCGAGQGRRKHVLVRPSQPVHVSIDDSSCNPAARAGEELSGPHHPYGGRPRYMHCTCRQGSPMSESTVLRRRHRTHGRRFRRRGTQNVLHCELFARATNRQLTGSMSSSRPLRTAQTTNSCLVSIPSLSWMP